MMDLPIKGRFFFELAFEELFVDAVTYGAQRADRVPEVFVSMDCSGRTVEAIFEDDAPQFNPLIVADPMIDANLDDRPIGGLGVYLVKNFMDQVEYDYVDGRNRIRMRKRVS